MNNFSCPWSDDVTHYCDIRCEVLELKKENKKLREALEQILDCRSQGLHIEGTKFTEAWEIADEVLNNALNSEGEVCQTRSSPV